MGSTIERQIDKREAAIPWGLVVNIGSNMRAIIDASRPDPANQELSSASGT
jgi:hypothetical protein